MPDPAAAGGPPRDGPEWELWRQDDNGNRFMIARFRTRDLAEAEQRRFDALGHKQTYWAAPRQPESAE